jgi:hypothetical protein
MPRRRRVFGMFGHHSEHPIEGGAMSLQQRPRRSFLFLGGGSRAGGNTETLAAEAARSLPSDVTQRWVSLRDLRIPDFTDARHDGDGRYPMPEGDMRLLLDHTSTRPTW